MKKIILLILSIMLIFITISCGDDPTPPIKELEDYIITFKLNNDEHDITMIVQENSLITPPEGPTKTNYVFAGWSKYEDRLELYDFELTPASCDLTLYAMWNLDDKDYSGVIDEYLPDVLSDDIVLPKYYGTMMLSWDSSNTACLDNIGHVINPRKDTIVHVKLIIYSDSLEYHYEKDVTVTAIKFPKLDPHKAVFGYYSTWNFNGITDQILKTVDVINLSFAFVSKTYELDYSDLLRIIPKLHACHKNGIRVVVSVQGYSSDGINFSNAAKTEAGRTKLANSMLEMIQKYNLDGIDIDWEYPGFNTGTPTSIDKENYTLLMKKIYETLKAADTDYLLTAAIPGWTAVTSRFDVKESSKYLDYIHMMTYDLNSSGKATHHTALYSSSYTSSGCSVFDGVQAFINAGVPKEKMVIGIAFYGKYFKVSSSNVNMGVSSSSCKTIPYTKIYKEYLPRVGDTVDYRFDENACAPYLLDYTNNYVITYDDETSILAKCNYALNLNLGGVMIWEVGEDATDTLLIPIYDVMKK